MGNLKPKPNKKNMSSKLITICSAIFLVISLAAPIANTIERLFFQSVNFAHAIGAIVILIYLPTFIVMALLLWLFIWLGFKFPKAYAIYCAVAALSFLLTFFLTV
jgi:hypothetical protein